MFTYFGPRQFAGFVKLYLNSVTCLDLDQINKPHFQMQYLKYWLFSIVGFQFSDVQDHWHENCVGGQNLTQQMGWTVHMVACVGLNVAFHAFHLMHSINCDK